MAMNDSSSESMSCRMALGVSYADTIRPTAGSRRMARQTPKSGPWTVAESALMRMLMMMSGLLSWGLNWYLWVV